MDQEPAVAHSAFAVAHSDSAGAHSQARRPKRAMGRRHVLSLPRKPRTVSLGLNDAVVDFE